MDRMRDEQRDAAEQIGDSITDAADCLASAVVCLSHGLREPARLPVC